MAQITFFSQLSEVQLNDWEVQASDSVVNSYSSNDYSDRRTLNSYEFVNILNDYCDRLSENATFFNNDPSRQYVERYQNFHQEFAPETAILDFKIDALEARTTRLKGQIIGAITRLSGAQMSFFNNELEENFVSTKNLPNQNNWKSSAQRIDPDRKWGFSTNEILPLEVIQERVIPPKNITFTQLFYSNDRLNMGLFWIDSYSVESSVSSLVNFQTNQALASDSWGLPTKQRDDSHFEWNGFLNEETIRKPKQKGDVQVLSLEVTLAFQNSVSQGKVGKILVNIKLI